jgi:hypothetical protein
MSQRAKDGGATIACTPHYMPYLVRLIGPRAFLNRGLFQINITRAFPALALAGQAFGSSNSYPMNLSLNGRILSAALSTS